MTEPTGPFRQLDLGPGAARALDLGTGAARVLAAELARRPAPKTALVVDAAPESAALDAAIDALRPDDRLAVVAPDPAVMRDHLAGLGSWVGDRVRVVDSPSAVDPVDVVLLARPLTGTAEQARATLESLTKVLAPGGVLVAPVVAVPGVAGGAAAELARQAALYGVGSDLVLRNVPPVRVHRLCWSTGTSAQVQGWEPLDRPSSVRLARDLRVDSNGVAAVGLALGAAALLKAGRPHRRWWLAPAAAALPLAAFFRDPERQPPEDGSLVVAASDGKVLAVERVTDDRFSGDGADVEYLRIATFLSVLDVHINRSPVAGRVVDYFRTGGGFAAAMTAAAERNASAYTVLETERGRVAVAQRTGLVARRIVHRAPVGAMLARGERFGLIRFGSRTDIYLPAAAADPLVTAGDNLQGGATPIARWR